MMMIKEKCSGITNIGKLRDSNEDYYIIDETNQIYIVADGVGGNQAGEIASRFVSSQLHNKLVGFKKDLNSGTLIKIIKDINQSLLDESEKDITLKGMSTTLVFMVKNNDRYFWGNVGDSRVYLFRDQQLHQVSKDHSVVQEMLDTKSITEEEAFGHPLKHLITMAMGNDKVIPDVNQFVLEAGDKVLLCSDGLSDLVKDKDIESILKNVNDNSECLKKLEKAALKNGGTDNITIVLNSI